MKSLLCRFCFRRHAKLLILTGKRTSCVTNLKTSGKGSFSVTVICLFYSPERVVIKRFSLYESMTLKSHPRFSPQQLLVSASFHLVFISTPAWPGCAKHD